MTHWGRLVEMGDRISPSTALDRRTYWPRAALAIVLIAAASAWPLLNLGSRQDTLVTITASHGIEATDLLAAIPLVGAIIMLLTPWHRRMPMWTCLLIAAFGLGLGVATGFVIHELT